MSRLPKRIRILDYDILVKLVSSSEMADVVGDDDEEGKELEGAWHHDLMTIYIKKSLNWKERRATLLHELQHALVDLKERG